MARINHFPDHPKRSNKPVTAKVSERHTALQAFYSTPCGKHVIKHMCALLPPQDTKHLLVVGYTTPLLEAISRKVKHKCNSRDQKAHQETSNFIGLTMYGETSPSSHDRLHSYTVAPLKNPGHFPVPSALLFDKIVFLHSLEYSAEAASMLQEAWRLLQPEGRLVVAWPAPRFKQHMPQTKTQKGLKHLKSMVHKAGFRPFLAQGAGFLHTSVPWLNYAGETILGGFTLSHKHSVLTITQAVKLPLQPCKGLKIPKRNITLGAAPSGG